MSKCNCGERISQLEAALNELADKQSALAITASDIANKAVTPSTTATALQCAECGTECADGTTHVCLTHTADDSWRKGSGWKPENGESPG